MGKSREEYFTPRSSSKKNLEELIIVLGQLLARGYKSRSSSVVPSIDLLIDEVLRVSQLFVQPPKSKFYKGSVDQLPRLFEEKNPEITFGESVWSSYYETEVPDSDPLGNPRQITKRFPNRVVQPDPRLAHYFKSIAEELVQLKGILTSPDYKSGLKEFFLKPNEQSSKKRYQVKRRRAR